MAATAPHQTTPEDLRKVQDATRWRLVILHPRPEIRKQGDDAWDDGKSIEANPHQVLSIEWANWASGWLDAHQRNT